MNIIKKNCSFINQDNLYMLCLAIEPKHEILKLYLQNCVTKQHMIILPNREEKKVLPGNKMMRLQMIQPGKSN